MLPAELGFPVVYGLCLLSGACTAVQSLEAFILSAQGQQILQRFGLLPLDESFTINYIKLSA